MNSCEFYESSMNNEVIKVTVCERVNTEDVERGKFGLYMLHLRRWQDSPMLLSSHCVADNN